MDSLTRMRAFKSVVEAEGFSAAGRTIGRSKALLSKYVRELEDELGTLLINRTTRQFSLTDAGHNFYQRASEILRDLDDLHETVRETSGTVKGRIRLSTSRTFADSSMGLSLIEFAERYPQIRLDLSLDDRMVDLVEQGFDLAIRIGDLQDSGLIVRRLANFSLSLCASPDLIERVGMPQTPADLANLPCIVDTNALSRANWGFRRPDGSRYTISVSAMMQANSPVFVRAAALRGLGFAGIPRFLVAEDIKAGRLVELFTDLTPEHRGIHAIYPHRRYLPPRVRLLVDFMADWMKAHGYDAN